MQSKDIVTIVQNALQYLGYTDAEIDVLHDTEIDLLIIDVAISEPKILIGHNGEGLRALNHVVRQLCENTGTERIENNFMVDINGYSRKHIDMLKTRARIVADRVQSFKKDIPMQPMSAYDRLLIHSFLNSLTNIATESHGEGSERHIVVTYKES